MKLMQCKTALRLVPLH